MIQRKFNKAVARVASQPLYWFREVGTVWNCRECGASCAKGTIAFELVTRYATKNIKDNNPNKDQAVKHFICLDCAEKITEQTLDRIRLCKKGSEAYDLLTEI